MRSLILILILGWGLGCADSNKPTALRPDDSDSVNDNVILVPANTGDLLVMRPIDVFNPPLICVYRLRERNGETYLEAANPSQITSEGIWLVGDSVDRKYIIKVL